MQFSEDEIALHFVKRHVNDVLHVAKFNRWYKYDGKRWTVDEKRFVFTLARGVCREFALRADSIKTNRAISAKNLASAKTRAAVMNLASDDQSIAIAFDQLDSNPWLLNTPGGVVDLRSGQVSPHRPDYYITKMTTVPVDNKCPTPLWDKFLDRVSAGDKNLTGFVQRMAGYALTGTIREHAIFFLHGLGGNGKGVFVRAISGILGEYHRPASIALFTATKNDQHPTDLAGLHAARIVTASETEEGRPWAEARIKEITGGDKITARFMRQDFFDYIPQFKLIISGNHRPGLRSVDEAMRRRMHLIPFTVTIDEKERDPELDSKLRAEWPGILAWMVRGCLEWQRIGLATPAVIKNATAEYLAGEDTFKTFIDDCCVVGPDEWESSNNLFFRWKQWAQAHGEFTGTQRRFSQRLDAQGFIAEKRRVQVKGSNKKEEKRGFSGLSLNHTWEAPM